MSDHPASDSLPEPLSGPSADAASWRAARLAAFHSRTGGEVFASIAQPGDVWTSERDDEETIHAEARRVFSDLLEVASDRTRGEPHGRILLLPGDAGAGKTHLMGAFRREVERRHAGYFAYAQMSTGLPLRKYLLQSVVVGLDKLPPRGGESAWLRLSDALVERACIPADEREALRQEEDYKEPLLAVRRRLLEDLKTAGSDAKLRADFLTALLALQRRDGNANAAAMKYFRGEPLGEEELSWLCLEHRFADMEEPETLLEQLLLAMRTYGGEHGGAFVLCIDQIEDLYEPTAPQQQRFPEVVGIVRALAEKHPGVIVVLACLQDYYTIMRPSLKRSETDRLETNPPPVRLRTACNAEEVRALVRCRLAVLDAEMSLPPPPEAAALYPFDPAEIAALQGLRPREVLHRCHLAWERSRRTGDLPRLEIPSLHPDVPPDPTPEPKTSAWPQRWNDFRTGWSVSLPMADDELAALLASAVNDLAAQTRVSARARAAADLIHLELGPRKALAAICNAAAQGGRLSKQLDSVLATASSAVCCPVAVRSTEFAKSAKSVVMQRVGKIVQANGWRVVFPEADWRAIHAWRDFAGKHAHETGFAAWVAQERPLAEVGSLCKLVRLDELAVQPPEVPGTTGSDGDGTPPSDPAREQSPNPTDTPPGPPAPEDAERILLGETLGRRREPVHFERAWFATHTAVLGGTGSGKTTAAMTLLEGLLLRGVPVILVDRKGDLARYGHTSSLAALDGPEGVRFRERIDPVLYTPGNSTGRPLALSVLPARVAGATSDDRQIQAEDAASALGAMIGYTESRAHAQRRAALFAAIQVLLELEDVPPTLAGLSELIASEDPALLAALDGVPPRVLRDIHADLASFKRLQSRLLSAGAEPLEAERLLGLAAHAPSGGRTRLSIISTKALGADTAVQFWVAQLIIELARFASTHPSSTLQAVVMLDEADLYLPATGKPASKQPLENALRRFRSGGVGLVLASQNPGDFDYRCRENIQTWLVGKITQDRSREKLSAVFGDANATHLDKLPQHKQGEFCLVRADAVAPIAARRNLLRTEQMSDAEILAAARPT